MSRCGIIEAILTRAMAGSFTAENVNGFTKLQVISACNNLVHDGRLVRVRRGKPGRFGAVLTKYALARYQ